MALWLRQGPPPTTVTGNTNRRHDNGSTVWYSMLWSVIFLPSRMQNGIHVSRVLGEEELGHACDNNILLDTDTATLCWSY